MILVTLALSIVSVFFMKNGAKLDNLTKAIATGILPQDCAKPLLRQMVERVACFSLWFFKSFPRVKIDALFLDLRLEVDDTVSEKQLRE